MRRDLVFTYTCVSESRSLSRPRPIPCARQTAFRTYHTLALTTLRMYLYTEADVRDVEVDGDDGGEHHQAADGVRHEADTAAPAGGVRVVTAGVDQGNACIEPDGDGYLEERGGTRYGTRGGGRNGVESGCASAQKINDRGTKVLRGVARECGEKRAVGGRGGKGRYKHVEATLEEKATV